MKFNELNELNSTVIVWEGIALKTTQDPFVSDNGESYTAPAIDAEGNEYVLTWTVIDPEITDESEICEWVNPSGVLRVK